MKRLVVVVDDNTEILAMMQAVFETAGYAVQVCTNGASLRAVLDGIERLPDLLVLDICLEQEDGQVLCRQVKTDERTRHIPVILCSAQLKAREVRADSLADAFLEKPFHLRDLLALTELYAPLTSEADPEPAHSAGE
jgi:two-component system, OmpR family, response regulator VicR